MNAVIYARYSSDNQREESIEGQLRECKEYADQNGITVVRTYIDRALSAKTDSRPQFQQMIHDSATHTFEAVLVWKLDRFSRNRYDSAHYKRILKNNRVHVVSVTEPISNTPEGIMLESLLEGMAEYYSAELAEKVSRGHKENALKAKFNGGPVPLGYRIDSEHRYQIDPATAPVVQEAFQRYAAGESIRSIIESLNARGIRNSRGNPFTKNSFQTLLKNRRYLGEYRYKDTVIPNAIPAIIDPDCFDAVQRRCEIHRQAPAHNKADVHYLLTTKLFCGKCGTMMAGESGRSHTGTVHCYYKCGTRKRSGKEVCSLKPVRKEPLEQFVVQTALEKVLNDRVIDLLADKLLEYQSKENTRLPVLQAELKEVKRRIDNLVAAIEQGILTPATKARMEELEQQREALETSILQEQIEKPPITREQILFWFNQFCHGDPADIAFQEKVIDCFVNSIYLFDDRIVVNFNYQEGGRPVSLEEVLGSFLDGNGAPSGTRTQDPLIKSQLLSVTARTKAVVHRGSKAHKNRPGGCLQLTIACMKCQRFLTDMSCQKSQGGVPVRRRPGYILIARNDLLRLCPLHIPGCLFPAETILEHQLLNNLAGVHPHAFENISSARNACIPSSLHTIVIDTFAVIAHSLKLALKITQYKLSVLFAQFQRVSHLVKAHSSSHKLLDIFKQVCQAPFFTAFVRQFFHNAAHTAHSFVCIFVFCHLIGKNCIVHAFWICTEEIVHNRSNRIFASILSVHINDMCLVLKRCRQFPNRTVNMVERQCTLEIVVFRDEDHIRFRKIFQSFARPCNIGVHHGTVVTRPLR